LLLPFVFLGKFMFFYLIFHFLGFKNLKIGRNIAKSYIIYILKMMILGEDIFDYFGKISLDGSLSENWNKDCVLDIWGIDKLECFYGICGKIFEDGEDFNVLLLHNLVFNLVNSNIREVHRIIIRIFEEVTLKFRNDVEEALGDNKFSI